MALIPFSSLWGFALVYPVIASPYLGLRDADDFLSGTQNLLLNVLGTLGSTSLTLTDPGENVNVGEVVDLGGSDYELVGTGTAQPGISLLGIIVPTGFPVDMLLFQNVSTGNLAFVYPDGAPNLLSAVAMVTIVEPQGYSMTASAPVCFAHGTKILTPDGPRAVETLVAGDDVVTFDGDCRTILYVTRRTYGGLRDRDRPVMLERGCLGTGLPAAPIQLSQQHRIQVDGGLIGRDRPHLVPAKTLVLAGMAEITNPAQISYVHLVCAPHAVILSEGLGVETLLLGRMTNLSLGRGAIHRILDALGGRDCSTPALPILPPSQAARAIFTKRTAR